MGKHISKALEILYLGKIFNCSVITGEPEELKKEVTQNWNWGKCVKGNRKAGPYPPQAERGNSSVGYSILGSSICGMKNLAQAFLESLAGEQRLACCEAGAGSWETSPPHQRRLCTCGIPVMTQPGGPYFDGSGSNREWSVCPRAAGAGEPQLLPRQFPDTAVVESPKCYCWKSFCASTWEQLWSL